MDDKLTPNRIPKNLNVPSPGAGGGGAPPKPEDVVRGIIAAALPEIERWAPATLSDRSRVGHGARIPTLDERAEELADRATSQAGVAPQLDEARVRRAHAVLNTLFAGFFARPRGVEDVTAMKALSDVVAQAEAFERDRQADRDDALAALLMIELPAIYEQVQRGEVEDQGLALVRDLLRRTGLLPADPALLGLVLDELVVEPGFIDHAYDDLPGPSDAERTTTKLRGAVETASYTLSAALDLLGVLWPHQRGKLMKARKVSDRARASALTPGPFGSHVGPREAAGYAEQSAFAYRRR